MAALLETEKPKTETKLNVPLLRAALLLIEADPHGFDMTGFAVASVITAHGFPVNLKEHLAFVLGLNYLRLGEFDGQDGGLLRSQGGQLGFELLQPLLDPDFDGRLQLLRDRGTAFQPAQRAGRQKQP